MRQVLVTAAVIAFAAPAAAQQHDYFADQREQQPLSYRLEGVRTSQERIVAASLFAGAVVFGGLGLYCNLEARDAADEVSQRAGTHSNLTYTEQLDQRRADAETYNTRMTVLYGTGGALLVAGIVYFIWTSPPDRLVPYGSEQDTSDVTYVAPTRGGAVVGKVWRY